MDRTGTAKDDVPLPAQWPREGGGTNLGITDCRLVLQIHDELIYEVREHVASEAIKMIKQCMEGAVRLKVPLKVNMKIGGTWGGMQAINMP